MTVNLRFTALCVAVSASGILTPLPPAAADWLVTRDGSAIETDGPWRVDGEQVVFTLRGGGLAALPAEEVDLEASRERTSPATPPAPVAGPPSRWTITDSDVARALDVENGGGAATGEEPEQTSAVAGVSVVSWAETAPPEAGGVSLSGTLRNDGTDYSANLRLQVSLHDEAGALIERRTAIPTSSTLAPGDATDFAVDFPDVVGFSDVRFTVEGRGFSGARPAVGEEAVGEFLEEAEEFPLEEESLEEVPEETLDETYGEGIEEEFPPQPEEAAVDSEEA